MKTKLLIFLLVFAFTKVSAQNYYKIVFAGNPENVFVENLSQGKSVSLLGADTLLLKFKGTSVRESDQEHHKLTIYPNPMDQTCNFDFDNQKPGRVIIQVFNANGSMIHKYSNKLPHGIQHFQLSGVPSGVYVIYVKTATGHYSGSFVSTDKSSTAFLLMNKSDSPEENDRDQKTNNYNNTDIANVPLEYRNSVELDFATGDQLMFVGFATGFENDTVYASPIGDSTITFIFCAKPDQPSEISGNINPCTGATESYSVTNVAGVTYTWSVPSGWNISAGQGTNSITVTIGSSSGDISVTPSNNCGSGPGNLLPVTTNTVPAQLSAISGIYNPCQGATGVIYSVNNVAGVTYTWSVPSDWTITSGNGTSNITVTAGTSSGNITVIPTNTCGNGPTNSFAVTAQTEALQPSAINGKENPCQGNSEIYSVTNVFGINYLWSVPSDWTITSGQNTHNITVTVGSVSGNIMVTPSNGCGNGPANSLAVTTQTGGAGQPSAITGNNNPCEGSTGLIYSVINVAGLIYTWTVPAGWSITGGQGTNSITVTAGIEAGNITVTPSNDCGNGPSNSIAVSTHTVPAQPSEISGNNTPCPHTEEYFYSVTEVPGVSYFWTLPTGWTITAGQNTGTINVLSGTEPGIITVTPSNDCGNGEARTLAVTLKEPPAQPSEISGNINPCQGTTGLIYSVINDPEVINYTWNVPTGWTITSGQNTNSITVTAGTSSGNISVTPEGECGQGPVNSFAVTAKLFPSQPSSISGNSAPCEETTGLVYSVTNVPGVTHLWTVPTNWNITSGQGTNSITVTTGFDWGNITVTPSNDCGNGTTRTLAVTTQTVPAQPSAISGNNNPCQGTAGLSYSVTNVSGVEYFWTVPSGWTITSGQNTNIITVTAGMTSGNITVTPSNDCGNGPANSFAVTTHTIPAQPSAITGNNNPCQGTSGLIYSVINISGVTYTWTVPSGWTITSGQGTNSITATASTSSGNITVTPSNDCGNGTAQTLAVTVQLVPSQPSAITGNNNPCQGATGLNYSVTNVSGVTYTWSVPSGWNITSGQGSNSITVTAGTSSGNISVTPSNTCGNGTAQTLAVTTLTIPAQPSTITGNSNPCQGATGLSYSVTNVSGVTYTWTVPADWNITAGQGTSIITVTGGSASGNITVTPSNTCGNGTQRTLAVTTHTVPAQPSAITGNNNPCQGATGLSYSITNVAGVTYTWTVPSGWTITAGQGTSSITATASTSSGNITVTPSNDCGNGTAQTLAVTVQLVPGQPSAITGNNNPCQDATGLNYSVTNVSGVTYTWSVPSGWNITSGQGSNSIIVTAGMTSGNISVIPSNTCGNGTQQSMAVTSQSVPATPTAGTHVPSQTQIVWNWNTSAGATGYKYNTINNFNTATDNGTSTTYTQTGLTCNTAYTLYVWAYNTCGYSSVLQLSQTTSACTPSCGSVTFTYLGSTVTYGTVISANNRCWLDRNLGASQVATSSTDVAAYGDLFQWGRLDDGHQVRTSPTTTTLSNSDVPGHGNFILAPNPDYDWRSPQNNNLWQGVNGINNPCPSEYRPPTFTEWNTERLSWSPNNSTGAFSSPLKLPIPGYRSGWTGGIHYDGTTGYYWSSTIALYASYHLFVSYTTSMESNYGRHTGYSVRCIKD